MDSDGNFWETETDSDNYYCYRVYYTDGSMMDCDGTVVTTDGYIITDQYVDADGNEITVSTDEDGNIVTETWNPTTGEFTEVVSNVDGLTVVYEEYDQNNNYIVYLEDSVTGDRIVEVYDYMGSITTTIYPADGSDPVTTKIDENGNEITQGYYDEDGNYITVYFD